ncbi:MAG TPA: recombination-associated protein RdgC [Steroidobacteraceae bacterium]
MWFKNLTVYRLPGEWSWSAAGLEEALARRPLQPCSPFEMRSMGWVPAATGDRLLHTLGEHHLLALGVDQKLLPASIVRQEAQQRARVQAETQGFPVGRRQMRALKMQVLEELRARALSRRRITRAWIDPRGGWLVVDSASDRRAEELVETLRDTLGTLAVQKVDTERSPSACMTAWLMQSDASGAFSIEQDLELVSGEPAKSFVRYRRHPLDGKEVRAYVAAGKRPTQLGLTWNGRVSFVLTEKMQIKRVEFLEIVRERGDEEEIDPAEQFDLDFAVMAGELAKLLVELIRELDGRQISRRAAAA